MLSIIPELGYGATVLALALAAYGGAASAAGALAGRPALGRSPERAAIGVWELVTSFWLGGLVLTLGACRTNLRSSAGFAVATLFLGEVSEGAVEAPSDWLGTLVAVLPDRRNTA